MNHETTVSRGRDGIEAHTVIAFGYDSRVLHLTTGKSGRGGISSIAQVFTAKDGFLTCALFQDFRSTLEADKTMRCTDKNVRHMHSRALEGIDDVMAAAKAKHPASAASTSDTLTDDVGPTAHIDAPMPDYLDDFNNPGSRHHY